MCTIPGIKKDLKQFDETISSKLILAIKGDIHSNSLARKLFLQGLYFPTSLNCRNLKKFVQYVLEN